MAARISTLVALLMISLLLAACSRSATISGNAMQVVEQGEGAGREDVEVIQLNNCDGKADAVQIAERGQSVQIETGAELGASLQVIQALINGTYAAESYTGKSIQLTAPPGTSMFFRLKWAMNERVGVVTNVGPKGISVAYHRFSPIDVQIVEQGDLGVCDTPAESSAASSQPVGAPAESGGASSQPVSTPTETAEPPTATPMPPPTAPPDTLPGSILAIGQPWRQGGLELVLKDAELGFDHNLPGFFVRLRLTSRKPQDIAIRYNLGDSVSATDNANNRLKVAPPYSFIDEFATYDEVLPSGGSIDLASFNDWPLFVEVDTTNPANTSVIVTASLYGIQDARWEIPIPH